MGEMGRNINMRVKNAKELSDISNNRREWSANSNYCLENRMISGK